MPMPSSLPTLSEMQVKILRTVFEWEYEGRRQAMPGPDMFTSPRWESTDTVSPVPDYIVECEIVKTWSSRYRIDTVEPWLVTKYLPEGVELDAQFRLLETMGLVETASGQTPSGAWRLPDGRIVRVLNAPDWRPSICTSMTRERVRQLSKDPAKMAEYEAMVRQETANEREFGSGWTVWVEETRVLLVLPPKHTDLPPRNANSPYGPPFTHRYLGLTQRGVEVVQAGSGSVLPEHALSDTERSGNLLLSGHYEAPTDADLTEDDPDDQSSSSPTIPLPNPSTPLTIKRAAEHWGGDMTFRKLRGLMDSGKVRFHKINRQTFIFSRDDIPKLPVTKSN